MNKITNHLNKTNSSDIYIYKPVIENVSDEKVRLSCDIKDNDEIKNLYFEVDKKYGKYLCNERSDAFVIGVLPHAMKGGKDIYCDVPVTEELLHNINKILVPALTSANNQYQLIKVHASTENDSIMGDKVSTGFSLGVDSFYTIFKNRDSEYQNFNINHLFNVRTPHSKLNSHYEEIKKAAKELDIPITFVITNITSLWGGGKYNHTQTHVYLFLAAVYAMRKLIRAYYYSTADDLTKFSIEKDSNWTADNYLLFLAYNFSTTDVKVFIEGLDVTRSEKVMEISNNELVQKYLRTCIMESYNCNVCPKCKRTLTEFDMLGVLDNYRNVYDVDYYLENKLKYFEYLVKRKNKSSVNHLYKHFLKTEPENMAIAKKLASDDLTKLKKEVERMSTSRSWKITKPLRKLKRIF